VPRSWQEEGMASDSVRASDGPPTAILRVGGRADKAIQRLWPSRRVLHACGARLSWATTGMMRH